jgi:hypothetical protein
LAKTYGRQHRYDDARAALKRAGLLDDDAQAHWDRAEARWLLEQARGLSLGDPQRTSLIARAETLATSSPRLLRRARKLKAKASQRPQRHELKTDWALLATVTGQAPPCGLPGDAAWFDASPINGEITDNVLALQWVDELSSSTVRVRYLVNQEERKTAFEREVPAAALPAPLRRWLALAEAQQTESAADIHRLHRLPIPFEVTGGAGASGVDLYPRLLPIETRPGEIDLYQ